MPQKVIQLKAFFKSYNEKYKKLTMLFLDDEIEPFTKSYLTKYYFATQHNPINGMEFVVKFDATKAKIYKDKGDQLPVPIQDMLDQVVKLDIYIKHYNFTDKSGKKIIGWNINLVKMTPDHY